MRKNWQKILIFIATLVLGAIAIITSIKLYQLRRVPVAPTVPRPAPAVATPSPTVEPTPEPSPEPTPVPECILIFEVTARPTGTPTPTGTPAPTATLTPTSTPVPTATPVYIAEVTPTPIPELPVPGITLPTLGATFGGILLIVLGLFFFLI